MKLTCSIRSSWALYLERSWGNSWASLESWREPWINIRRCKETKILKLMHCSLTVPRCSSPRYLWPKRAVQYLQRGKQYSTAQYQIYFVDLIVIR